MADEKQDHGEPLVIRNQDYGEPWEYEEREDGTYFHIKGGPGTIILSSSAEDQCSHFFFEPHIAKRIAATMNACRGIATEDLAMTVMPTNEEGNDGG